MIARGALIKPWIFTEVKEHREWDISSRERLQLIGKVTFLILLPCPPWLILFEQFAEFGLRSVLCLILRRRFVQSGYHDISHFGTDTTGVNTTRRFLCEALSFQYRYVPIGLLEQLPAKINDRAPAFKGRDELGTSSSVV